MIPMVDPARLHKPIQEELEAAALKVIRSGRYILGPEVEEFEKNIADYLNVKHAITVSSGTDALLLALECCGSNVAVPALSFGATAQVVWRQGDHTTPKFIDIDPITYCMDPKKLDEYLSINKSINVIMPVNLYGEVANIEEIVKVINKHNNQIKIIEDSCQSIGPFRHSYLSTLQCYSFYPTKNLGGFGEGGLITTDSDDCNEFLRSYRNCGMGKLPYSYEYVRAGNFRMDTLQAAMLNVKLKHLTSYIAARCTRAFIYNSELKGIELYTLPQWSSTHTFNQYTIRVLNGKRDACKVFLAAQGISTAIYYPYPLNSTLSGCLLQDCPEAEKACKEVLSLPIAPEITLDEIEQVITALIEFSKT